MTGNPVLHQNLSWFATGNDKVLGVVLKDKIDNDFSWVVLTQNEDAPAYTCIDMDASLPTLGDAVTILHQKMLEYA